MTQWTAVLFLDAFCGTFSLEVEPGYFLVSEEGTRFTVHKGGGEEGCWKWDSLNTDTAM